MPSDYDNYRKCDAGNKEQWNYPLVLRFILRGLDIRPEILHLLICFIGKIAEDSCIVVKIFAVGIGNLVILRFLVKHIESGAVRC